ncbi:MAG: hypothetical protein PSV36_19135 [Algoriphagus sp.]|nr:hypothetical protein [Algoriphagus sp.]
MDENQIITDNQNKINNFKKYEEAERSAIIKNKTEINQLVDCVNTVLADNDILERINSNQIRFEPNAVGNLYCGKGNKKLTEIFFDHVFPKANQECFAHFTSIQNAKSIVGSKSFWVSNLNKNAEAEYKAFYEDHGLLGFREKREFLGFETGYEENRKTIFSLSFTSENNNSEAMWESFGKGYRGVKLYFKVESNTDYFRKIRYSANGEKIKLLADLTEGIWKEFETTFRLYKISKVGAYYIPGLVNFEDEYRFIYDCINDIDKFKLKKQEAGKCYAIVPFENSIIRFQLLKIEKGVYCDQNEFEKLKEIVKRQYSYDIEFVE